MSLPEMLVALALTGAVLATTYTILEHGQRAHRAGAARAESQQSARAALDRLAREIRTAGRGGEGTVAAIVAAEATRIVIASDLDADGATTARGERITWQLVDDVLRRNAGAGAQPVANGVRHLAFRYFDAAGAATTVADDIRIVEVTLVTGPDGSDRLPGTSLSTRIRLRNR